MRILRLKLFLISLFICCIAEAQQLKLLGVVVDDRSGKPIEFATVMLVEDELWAVTAGDGSFEIAGLNPGRRTLTVQALGYKTLKKELREVPGAKMQLRLKADNLSLDEVTVTAHRKQDEATTSYVLDRQTLDNQQIIDLADISSLLPGGKTANGSLLSDSRLALRSGSQEKGNASFGTAIEVDGMRLDNNAVSDETLAAPTRTVSTANVESVEIVTGIPSVEYGDLSNGIVKVRTRKGKSPFIVEGRISQNTRQLAVSKGFDLGHRAGMLNASFERARSFSDPASPYTAYQRNILSLSYTNVLMPDRNPLTLTASLTGNIGGYNSKADPDNELDDYSKVRDNVFRGNLELRWLLNRSWITNLQLAAALTYGDRRAENYNNASSASTQPYIHSAAEGYFIAQDYDLNPNADIVLGPTGYWYVKSFNDNRPLTWQLKLKGDWNRRFGRLLSKFIAGVQFGGSRNLGRGTYYDDMRYAPTWREYRYDRQPSMNNLAIYAEEKLSVPVAREGSVELTAGVRSDITMIRGSDYGTVGSLSPRFNARYVAWKGQQWWVSDLQLHAGWGKSVKLPSAQVLYPTPSYSDRLAFASTSTSDNRSYYSYHTFPHSSIYNPDLRWQYTNQTDLGVEMTVKGTRISLSAYHHRTHRSYMSVDRFVPFTYKYTPPASLNGCPIAVADRIFSVDRQTGIVTVSDATGTHQPMQLDYNERKTFSVNNTFVNATPVDRYGLEWIVDFAQIRALRTSIRIDGNYYHYKGLDDTLFPDIPLGVNSTMAGNQPYQYVGYYRGSSVTGTAYSTSASIANGSLKKSASMNVTVTTHIPSIRMIVSLRGEFSLYNYARSLSQLPDGLRGIVLEKSEDYFGTPYDGTSENSTIALYPEYYTTWDNPSQLIPFEDKLRWAYDNDKPLFNELTKLIVRTNYPYTMNPNRLSKYYSANLTVTKEIGDHVTLSFYANNFFNNMKKVRSSQTDLESSLFGSGYIPQFYYGLSLKLKL